MQTNGGVRGKSMSAVFTIMFGEYVHWREDGLRYTYHDVVPQSLSCRRLKGMLLLYQLV
jgi:hypothetical protein